MLDRMTQKNGSDRVQAIQARLERVGRAHGIQFAFDGKTGNTRDSHRLIELAGTKGANVQTALVAELFAAHFERAGDITSRDELIWAGSTAGLEESEMLKYLQDDSTGREVDHKAEEARASGISSVPTFEIQGRRIQGAEDPSEFYQTFVARTEGLQSNR